MNLKRSAVEESIELAKAMFRQFGIQLPPYAFWTVGDWARKGKECDEIRCCRLGWDVTDFGSGDFSRIGRTLFTLSNGNSKSHPKTYAEKLILNPEGQRAPAHYHRSKMEDISHRAGGRLAVQILGVNGRLRTAGETLRIQIDGQTVELEPEGRVHLKPGQRICIPPFTIHQFWGEGGLGVSSEVSSVCNDVDDNFFLEPAERFPPIIEDTPRRHYLCHEYPPAR